jgi:O-antigen ligase
MNDLALLVLILSVLALTLWGGGISEGPVYAVAVATCAVLLAVRRHARRAATACGPVGRASFPWLEACCAAFLLLVAFTAVPLPDTADALIGVERRAQNQAVTLALADAADLNYARGPTPRFALTRNLAGTLRFLVLAAAVFGSGLLSASLTPRHRLAYLKFVVLAGSIVAVGGHIGQWHVPQGDTLWWYYPIGHVRPGPAGCFVNRNHFGGFVALLVPAAIALAVDSAGARQRAATACFAVLAAAMTLAVVFSLSRGALVACAVALAGSAVLLAVNRRFVAAAVLAVALVVGAGAAAHLPHPAVQERLASFRNPLRSASLQTRLSEWRESLRVWRHYPLVGAGGNALRVVYPQYRRTASGGWLMHAENEYVELLAETGVIGVGLAAGLAVAGFARYRARRSDAPWPLVMAGVGALLVAGIHALFDFAPSVPLYAVVLASLAGLLIDGPQTVSRPGMGTFSGGPRPPACAEATAGEPGTGRRAGSVADGVASAPAALGLVAACAVAGAAFVSAYRLDTLEYLQGARPGAIRRGLVWAPSSSHAWYAFGRTACSVAQRDRRPDLYAFGERCVTEATAYDPQNYRLWYLLGGLRHGLGDVHGAEKAYSRARALRSWLNIPDMRSP